MAMNEQTVKLLATQVNLLADIKAQLEQIAQASVPQSPNYRRRLAEYSTFDWSSIGATIIEKNKYGAVEVEWHGHRFIRRSGSGKFGKAIWFSRPLGQDENGTQYARLITFKDYSIEPLAFEPPVGRPAQAQAQQRQTQAQAARAVDPLVAQAQQVTDPPGFYKLVNQLLALKKIDFQDVSQIVNAGDLPNWSDKAAALLAAM